MTLTLDRSDELAKEAAPRWPNGAFGVFNLDLNFIHAHSPAYILCLNAELRLLRELEALRRDRANQSEEEREVLERLNALMGKEKP